MSEYTQLFRALLEENRDAANAAQMEQYMRNQYDFFRKAIGWALRQYSKFYPELVVRFVEQTSLSGLSKTEALKVINRNKQ